MRLVAQPVQSVALSRGRRRQPCPPQLRGQLLLKGESVVRKNTGAVGGDETNTGDSVVGADAVGVCVFGMTAVGATLVDIVVAGLGVDGMIGALPLVGSTEAVAYALGSDVGCNVVQRWSELHVAEESQHRYTRPRQTPQKLPSSEHGGDVGLSVGASVGEDVGVVVGDRLGIAVGVSVGKKEGDHDGAAVGVPGREQKLHRPLTEMIGWQSEQGWQSGPANKPVRP